MNSMVHIGNEAMHESAKDTAEAIVSIFKGARENTMDQATVQSALETFGRVAEVKNVNVSNNVFTNNPQPLSTTQPDPSASPDSDILDDEDDSEEEGNE